MAANSLIVGLITYTAAVVYNLLAQKSLETVFFLGLRFLLYTTLMTLFLQLSFYLIKNYNSKDKLEAENESKTESNNSAAEAEENIETVDSENQEFKESSVENEFDNEGFSALNQEEFDYQQNINQ
jgi:predicted membrane protein